MGKQDIPDLIAGALGVSRGTAYDMMREALAEQPAPVHQEIKQTYRCDDPECVVCCPAPAQQPLPAGFIDAVTEAAAILGEIDPNHAPKNMRWPLADELDGFVGMIKATPQPPAQPLTDEQNRDLFAAFVKKNLGDIAVMDGGRYISPKINNYWLVWQEARGITKGGAQ